MAKGAIRDSSPSTGGTETRKLPTISEEFAGAQLGDKRRTRRLQLIGESFAAAPDKSLPAMAGTSAATEGLYRFINSEKFEVTVAKLLEPHAARSLERSSEHETVLVIHDGTDIKYPYEGELRQGFGRMGQKQGIQALVSLAVAFSETSTCMTSNDEHEPLGVVACQTFVGPRKRKKTKKKTPPKKKTSKRGGSRWGRVAANEWHSSIVESTRVLNAVSPVHVIDREGDAIELFARLQKNAQRFVIRALRKRKAKFVGDASDEFKKITEAATVLPRLFEEVVEVSDRDYEYKQANPARDARTACLTYAAGEIRIKRPPELRANKDVPSLVTLNLVHVKERNAPKGEEPIEWFLLTSEPIATEMDVRRVVRMYRARWLIEEFFRVLKTGCALKKRQVESRQALEAILGISLVVAWRILFLRHKSRLDDEAPASVGFTVAELDLLQKMRKLPTNATLKEALLKVAELGGHLKQNGAPGNMVLARGLEKLEAQAEVWAFVMAEM